DDRGILAVSGADRRSFLQGLVSNDIDKVAPDRAVYAALLTAQGKYLHDFIMATASEAIWLDGESARLADLKRRLSMYRLRAQVVEKSILLEAGFDEWNGVGWQKGGYVGRALTARTKCRGLIKKRLFPVRGEGPAPPPGALVTSDGKEVGEMRSRHDGQGLAL